MTNWNTYNECQNLFRLILQQPCTPWVVSFLLRITINYMPLEGTGGRLCAYADLHIKNSDHYKLLKTVMQKCLQSGNCKKFFTT